ncbi:MAG: CPBP family intramembrane metalloprotease, partial [Anaerolineales bacterium]|nr:CPBP family intramembrane metalloprotease [Anaerolineales bacterium]
ILYMTSKWLAPILPYLAVWVGLFLFKSAWGALIGFHIAIVVALLWLRSAPPIRILIKPAPWKSIVLNGLLCSLGGVGLYFLWDILGVAVTLGAQLQHLGISGLRWFWLIAYFSLVNPFVEEYFWRGALGSNALFPYGGDLVYAGYHVMVVWNMARPHAILLMLLSLVFAGWLWRQIYRRDGSLLAPALGHMAADLSILLAVFIKVG